MRCFMISLAALLLGGSTVVGAQPLAAPPGSPGVVDPSRVKFLLAKCKDWDSGKGRTRVVHGRVSSISDLNHASSAWELIQMGVAFAQEQCPSPSPSADIKVCLRPGDPATFTNAQDGFEGFRGSIHGYPRDSVSAGWDGVGKRAWYSNVPLEDRERQEQQEAQAARENAALAAAQRAAQDQRGRSTAFVKTHGVQRIVTAQQMAANPFVYKGQVVAVYATFQQMNSETQALFESHDQAFVVSGVGASRFTQRGSKVMLAARVLGNTEIKLPVLGPTLVPHLSYVASAPCQQVGCND